MNKKCLSDAYRPVPFEREIKSVVIVHRPESNNAVKSAFELSEWLRKRAIQVFSHPQQKLSDKVKKVKESWLKAVDLVIVLGGDGTYLHAVRMLAGQKIPILGVNMGSLGFLTENRRQDLYSVVQMTLDGKMEMRPRAMIDVKVHRHSKIISEARALNDVVIERGQFSQLISIEMYSKENLVGDVKADGIVIATPTGSTAYNLSAGGPILHPHVRAFVVTPICPHSLTHRPILFPDDQALTFKLLKKKQKALLTVDGQTGGNLIAGDEVIVTRAKCNHYMLRRPTHRYFDLLREKLKFGER